MYAAGEHGLRGLSRDGDPCSECTWRSVGLNLCSDVCAGQVENSNFHEPEKDSLHTVNVFKGFSHLQ